MAIIDVVQAFEESGVDARSLSAFMFKPANVMVSRRLAPPIHTLNYYLDILNGIGGQVQDAINNTAVNGGILADTFVTATAKTGGVARTQRDKNSEVLSVKDFGAKGDGVTDDTSAFQACVNQLKFTAKDYQTLNSNVLKTPSASVIVPSGNYVITSKVASEVIVNWQLADNAIITGMDFLDGIINRVGRHINSLHSSILENATTLSLRGNSDLSNTGGVFGIKSLGNMSVNGPPHSVTLQTSNDTRNYDQISGTIFRSTSVTYKNTIKAGQIKLGYIITIIPDAGAKYMGQVTEFNLTSKTITVNGWYKFTGFDGDMETPPNGAAGFINYFNKIWGQNTNVFLRSNSATKYAAGYEMGVLNYQQDMQPLRESLATTGAMWGYDAVNLGNYKSTVAFIARAGGSPWRTGFASYGNEIGFQVFNRGNDKAQVGFSYEGQSGFAFQTFFGGERSLSITAEGNMEIGRTDASAVPFIDLHSSGNNNDYDSRIFSVGGEVSSGKGSLGIISRVHNFLSHGDNASTPTTQFKIVGKANATSYLFAAGGDSSVPPTFNAEGVSANIDIKIQPKGAGHFSFGRHVASASAAITGYIEIKDSLGVVRKLAVID